MFCKWNENWWRGHCSPDLWSLGTWTLCGAAWTHQTYYASCKFILTEVWAAKGNTPELINEKEVTAMEKKKRVDVGPVCAEDAHIWCPSSTCALFPTNSWFMGTLYIVTIYRDTVAHFSCNHTSQVYLPQSALWLWELQVNTFTLLYKQVGPALPSTLVSFHRHFYSGNCEYPEPFLVCLLNKLDRLLKYHESLNKKEKDEIECIIIIYLDLHKYKIN